MHSIKHLWRQAALALGGATAGVLLAFGGTPALASSLVQIYGSGASLQEQLQTSILIPDSKLSPAPTYTTTTSGSGSLEFGNTSGKLELALDKTAEAAKQLDAYVGVDSPPTTLELNNASTASGSLSLNEVTVPVAQTSLTIILSLPTNLLLNTSAQIKLPNLLVGQLFAGTIPLVNNTNGDYAKNTWGALLSLLGFTKITSGSPSATQFLDNGGGSTMISVQTRKNGAGTTLNLKQYALSVDLSDWSGTTIDENAYGTSEWPSGALITASPGNSTDAAEVSAVMSNAGQVGYATAGDTVSGGFSNVPTLLGSGSSAYQVLYASVQDNGTSTSEAKYASPVTNTLSNVYIGSNKVGTWNVPAGEAWTSTWAGTNPSDPNVFNDSGEEKLYPIVAVAYDLAWANYSTTNLLTVYPEPANTGFTAQQFLEFATSSAGQTDTEDSSHYYAKLPSSISKDAEKAAAAVN